MNVEDAPTIGARARMIRRRRGLGLEVVAGLAGITKTYLPMLELGQRGFNLRGLIEDLAQARGCSVTELQTHALRAGLPQRTHAFTALVQARVVRDLAISAARRGYDVATRHGHPALIGFAS